VLALVLLVVTPVVWVEPRLPWESVTFVLSVTRVEKVVEVVPVLLKLSLVPVALLSLLEPVVRLLVVTWSVVFVSAVSVVPVGVSVRLVPEDMDWLDMSVLVAVPVLTPVLEAVPTTP
jgi:hypothetical protein